jgi:hypothetical protein
MPLTPRQCLSVLTALVVFGASVCCTCAASRLPAPREVVVSPAGHAESSHACCHGDKAARTRPAESGHHSDSHCPHCARPELSVAPAFHKLTAGSVDLLTHPILSLAPEFSPLTDSARPTASAVPTFHPPSTLLGLHCALTT